MRERAVKHLSETCQVPVNVRRAGAAAVRFSRRRLGPGGRPAEIDDPSAKRGVAMVRVFARTAGSQSKPGFEMMPAPNGVHKPHAGQTSGFSSMPQAPTGGGRLINPCWMARATA
jgi:hypothetical protein